MSDLLEKVVKETESLKRQQKEHLKDFTTKIRKLEDEYNSLLDKKKELKDFLNSECKDEKAGVDKVKSKADKRLRDRTTLMREAGDIKAESENIKKELEACLAKEKEDQAKHKKDRAESIGVLRKKLDEKNILIRELEEKHLKINNIKEVLGEQKIEINKEKLLLITKAKDVKHETEENIKAYEKNEMILKTNTETLKRITEVKNAKDKVLHKVYEKTQELLRKTQALELKEKEFDSFVQKMNKREKELAVSSEYIKKRLKEANDLYTQWKNKGGNRK